MKLLVLKNPDNQTLARCIEWPDGAERPNVEEGFVEMSLEEYEDWLKEPEQLAKMNAINATLDKTPKERQETP